MVCDKCGGKLVFNGGMMTICESCTTAYALVAEAGGSLRQVSYLPVGASKKMVVPLKISIAKLLKQETDYIVQDGKINDWDLSFNDAGVTVCEGFYVTGDDEPLYVAIGHKESDMERKVCEEPNFWNKYKTEYYELHPSVTDVMRIEVKEVTVDGRFVGNSVYIGVCDERFEEEASRVYDLILKKFGVVPKCVLLNG